MSRTLLCIFLMGLGFMLMHAPSVFITLIGVLFFVTGGLSAEFFLLHSRGHFKSPR